MFCLSQAPTSVAPHALVAEGGTYAQIPISLSDHRLNDAATVFSEGMDTPDKGIPQDLLEKAYCIVIVPSLKKGLSLSGPSSARNSYLAATRRSGAIGLLPARFGPG
jgi:hypothetical protein